MRKNQLIGAVAGGLLGAGVGFAFELSSLGPDLTNTSDSIGFMIGSFAGIGSVILPSVTGGKQEGKSETSTFLQGDMMKWALPLVLGIGSLGVFLGAPDAGSKFNQGFMRGLMDAVWSGLLIRTIMQFSTTGIHAATGVITGAAEGVTEGVRIGLKKKTEKKVRGPKDNPDELEKAKDFVDALRNAGAIPGIYPQVGFGGVGTNLQYYTTVLSRAKSVV